jgi:choline-sulfatase
MEQLRGESVYFTKAYTAAMACCPSRHVFLTGQHTWKLGDIDNRKFSTGGETTWMSILRDRGYACISVGKTHLLHAGSLHVQVDPQRSWGDQGGWDHFHPAASPEDEKHYFDVATTRRACQAMQSLQGAQPFAMFIGLHAPHEPYVMPQRYLDYMRPEDAPLPKARRADEYRTKSRAYRDRVDHFKKMFGPMTDEDIRRGIAGHHCLLKLADDCLGQLLQTIRSLGLMDNTLIIYCSDHGDLLGEHSLFNKAATHYEGEIHIPLLMRFPDGRGAGRQVSGFASSVDVMPTILAALGIDADIVRPGRSLLPLIDHDEPVRDTVVCATVRLMMVRNATHKIWYNCRLADGEMYDLAADPLELNNLYNDPLHRDLRADMMELLLRTRMGEDANASAPTRRDMRWIREALAANEPEVTP